MMSNPGTVAGTLFDPELMAGSPETFGGGGSKLPMFEQGLVYRNNGFPIAQNAANTSDNILDGFQLPAGSLDKTNRTIQMQFQGNLGANITGKTIKIWANPVMVGQTITASGQISGGTVTSGTILYNSGAQTGNAIGWNVSVDLTKTGAFGSNSQTIQATPIYGTAHGGVTPVTQIALAENLPINLVITGASATSTPGDVTLTGTSFDGQN